VRKFCSQEGSVDADVRTFWCKNIGFFEIYDVSAQTRGLSRGHFADRGINFSRYCADALYGRPLIMDVGAKSSAATKKHTMMGQKYFKEGQTSVWGEYTKYNKINSNSENFREGKNILNK